MGVGGSPNSWLMLGFSRGKKKRVGGGLGGGFQFKSRPQSLAVTGFSKPRQLLPTVFTTLHCKRKYSKKKRKKKKELAPVFICNSEEPLHEPTSDTK